MKTIDKLFPDGGNPGVVMSRMFARQEIYDFQQEAYNQGWNEGLVAAREASIAAINKQHYESEQP